MVLRLTQMLSASGDRIVIGSDGVQARRIKGVSTVLDLAHAALAARSTLAEAVESAGYGESVDLRAALAEKRILAPVDHPDPARILLSGTGLTHLGSAAARDRMHADDQTADQSDSMRMFRLGLEGGKPPAGRVGVQPEWFFKGDGRSIVGPEEPLPMPAFALDGGEEAELAGIYLIAADGTPCRLGFALANEFSDHITERANYLYLAHSKLRPAALGPELWVGSLPEDIRGAVRVRRGERILWEKPFHSGEANMSHSVRNLEHHHFKYSLFRRSGDVHVHFFGTATLSFADGVRTQAGDVFEIEAPPFTLPLRNALSVREAPPTNLRVL